MLHALRQPHFRVATILAIAGLVVLVSAASSAAAASSTAAVTAAIARDAAYKAATDTDPHLPLTPWEQRILLAKQEAVAAYFSAATGRAITAGAITNADLSALAAVSPDSSASVAENQTAQTKSYYCGPASVHEALGQCGYSISQATAASQLGTTTDGTPWSGGSTSTGHPVPDVMNAHESRCPYIPQAVPGSPSSADISNYKSCLVSDISSDSAPLIGDAWETANSAYHLVGHPTDRTIFHWFDIRGFTSTGGNTLYEDSVHNATSVSWYASVPAYSTQLSNQIVTIVGGRGYVW